MGKALFFVLACALIVAVIADYELNDDTLEFFETEKRGMGRSLKKYKSEYIEPLNFEFVTSTLLNLQQKQDT